MKLAVEILHDKYRSITFIKPRLDIKSLVVTNADGIEILTIEIANNSTITSVYKSPNIPFVFHSTNFNNF